MKTDENNEESAQPFKQAFYDLPSEDQLASMSILDIAELLVNAEKGSVPYIVLSHELNMKIARKEAAANHKNAWIAGIFSILGAIIGAAFTALAG